MSRMNKTVAVMKGRAMRTGHGYEAREKNIRAAETFTRMLFALGMPFDGPEDLEVAHFLAFVAQRLADGIDIRTLHNDLSAIRGILKVSRHKAFAKSRALKSRALGVPKGSRKGTNRAITAEALEELLVRAKAVDEALYWMLKLEFLLGLRGKEALMSYKSLAQWEAELLAGEPVSVVHGTKNDRPRLVHPVDVAGALEAVRGAMAVAVKRGGKLILGTLKQALARYTYLLGPTRLHVKGHSLRYAYAKARYLAYRAAKHSVDDALARVCEDLGHGEDRGPWLRQVYLRGVARKRRARRRAKNRTGANKRSKPTNRKGKRTQLTEVSCNHQ